MLNMKIIYGSKNETILVDDEDYEMLSKYVWNCFSGYAKTYRRKKEDNYKLKSESMHRMVMKANKTQTVDHKNGNKLDNQKSNLRFCNTQQNSCNRKISRTSKSKYLGVAYHKRDNKWQAQIRTKGERIYLGSFPTAEEAAIAYNEAAIKYHGEFARINKIHNTNILENIACSGGACEYTGK
jgi:hypothetical protein